MSLPWDFTNLESDRKERLLKPCLFDGLAKKICDETMNISYKREKGDQEAKGYWRPTFSINIQNDTCDYFFNSPFGYRGQFLESPAQGEERNRQLIATLINRLLGSKDLHLAADIKGIEASLRSDNAKIWIDERFLDKTNLELRIEILVPSWVANATAEYEKWEAHVEQTEKERDRIMGVRAPEGNILRVFGAWVAKDGSLFIVPSKTNRAEEIRLYGIS